MSAKAKVDDRVWQALRKKIGGLEHARVKVGVLQSQGGQESHPNSDLTLAELAAIHEYGAPRAGIPARSFLRRTFEESEGRDALNSFLTRLARAIIAEKLDVHTALEQLGAKGAAMVKKRIKDHIPPPNAPATIKRKGSSTPLVRDGHLVDSITHEVIKT